MALGRVQGGSAIMCTWGDVLADPHWSDTGGVINDVSQILTWIVCIVMILTSWDVLCVLHVGMDVETFVHV